MSKRHFSVLSYRWKNLRSAYYASFKIDRAVPQLVLFETSEISKPLPTPFDSINTNLSLGVPLFLNVCHSHGAPWAPLQARLGTTRTGGLYTGLALNCNDVCGKIHAVDKIFLHWGFEGNRRDVLVRGMDRVFGVLWGRVARRCSLSSRFVGP